MSAFLYTAEGRMCCIPSFGGVNNQLLITFASQVSVGHACGDFYLVHNGHLVHPGDMTTVSPNDVLRVVPRLPGGKGGFGSMLRAIGAQIEKTTSREACRDLSGRRMRDVNDEKKINEWISKQADREREAAKLKQERLERKRAGPRHNFDDTSYTRQIQENADKIEDALKQGLTATPSTSGSSTSDAKHTSTNNGPASKKPKLWLGMDELDEDSDEDMEDIEKQTPISNRSTSTSTYTATSSSDAATSHQILPGSSEMECRASSSANDDEIKKETELEGEQHESHIESPKSSSENDVVSETQAETSTEKLSEQASSESDCTRANSKECTGQVEDNKPFRIDDYNSAAELESIGLDRLKANLMALGLKCGGTLQERAQRLFLTKGVPLEQLDPSLFAKPATFKGKKNKQKK